MSAAAGVGNWDNIIRTGGWDVGISPPLALGVEAAGVIKAVGADPGGFGVGDEVLCHPVPLRGQGTWAPFLIAPVGSLAHKPPEISWETAAIFPVPALTAEQVIAEALALRGGETVLVNGAGGITGGLIVQLAALRGVDVLATASPRSADRVRGEWRPRSTRLPRSAVATTRKGVGEGLHPRRRQRGPRGCCCSNDRTCRRRPAGHHHPRPTRIRPRDQCDRGLRPFRRSSTRPPHRATRVPSVEHADPAFLQPGSGWVRPRTRRRRPRAQRSGHHERHLKKLPSHIEKTHTTKES